jgi:hypothetical protein
MVGIAMLKCSATMLKCSAAILKVIKKTLKALFYIYSISVVKS